MKQQYELGQFVTVHGISRHPDKHQRESFHNDTCVITGSRIWSDNLDYQVIRATDVGALDARNYWIPSTAIVEDKKQSSEQHLFVNKANGQWFYGTIIHATEKNLLVDKCGGQNEEVLVCKDDYKIYLEVSL